MRRLIIAGALTIFICVSLVFGIYYIKSICNQTNDLLDECISAYNYKIKNKEKAENLSKYWEKKEKTLSFIVNHDRLDEIESAIGSLKDYSDTEENEKFYEYSGIINTLLHQLLEDTLPGVHSIF